MLIFICMSLLPLHAIAEVCDLRPSNIFGGTAAGVAGGGVAAVGLGAKLGGFYTLTHAVTGATMLGSTAAGASAAGTVGIMGGTTVLGTALAVIMSPITIIVGSGVAVAAAGYEGLCYFQDERITEYADVLEVIKSVASLADPDFFRLIISEEEVASVYVKNGEGIENTYLVEDLYIVNGMLKHSDSFLFLDTVVGNINFFPKG